MEEAVCAQGYAEAIRRGFATLAARLRDDDIGSSAAAGGILGLQDELRDLRTFAATRRAMDDEHACFSKLCQHFSAAASSGETRAS